MDIIGKRLIDKFDPDQFRVVERVDDMYVHFTDKGRILKDNLYDRFENYTESKKNYTEPSRIYNTKPIEKNMNSNDILENFAPNYGGIAEQLEAQIRGISSNIEQPIRTIQQQSNKVDPWSEPLRPSYVGESVDLGTDYSGLSYETRLQVERQVEEAKKKASLPPVRDTWLEQQFNIPPSESSVKKFDPAGNEISSSNGYTNNGNVNGNINSTTDILNLPKMKKTLKVKLNIEMIEMIPKLEEIKVLESVFDFNLTERLAKDIVNKYINDRELFENMVIAELEKHIKQKKVVVKKVVKKTKDIDK